MYTARLKRLRQLLKEQSLDAVIISSVPNILYLTGYGGFSSEERDAYLFITQKEAYIITNALYITAAREQIKHMQPIEWSRDNPLKIIFSNLLNKPNTRRCGFEDTNVTVAEYTTFPKQQIEFISVELEALRIIKDTSEIKAIQNACKIGDAAYTYIQNALKTGMSEIELANKLGLFISQTQNELSFRVIAAFGKNAAVPHHFAGTDTLQKNMCVLLDFGVRSKNYCSDMTRTLFFGSANEEQKKVYETVRISQQMAIDAIKELLQRKNPEDISMRDIDHISREYIIQQGYPSIPHTLGHGIGLEVHEGFRLFPSSTRNFSNGMVFSIEPGIYLPTKFGVRIEDLFTIEDNKLIQLTHSPRELLEL